MNAAAASQQKHRVIFRRWIHDDKVIALFVDEPFSRSSIYDVTCYEHEGQHGGADYKAVIEQTTPASPEEYAELLQELEGLGYAIRPVKRKGKSK